MKAFAQWIRIRLVAVWWVQLVILLGVGFVWLLRAPRIAGNLSGQTGMQVELSLGADFLVQIGAMALGVGSFTVAAIRHKEPSHRYVFARSHAGLFAIWLLVVFYNISGHLGAVAPRITGSGVGSWIAVAFLFVGNLVGANAPQPATQSEVSSAARPSVFLKVLWKTQAAVLSVLSLAMIVAPATVASALVDPGGAFAHPAVWEADQLRIQGAYVAFVAYVSFMAARQPELLLHTVFARFFVVWTALVLGASAFTLSRGPYASGATAAAAGLLIILLANVGFVRRRT